MSGSSLYMTKSLNPTVYLRPLFTIVKLKERGKEGRNTDLVEREKEY